MWCLGDIVEACIDGTWMDAMYVGVARDESGTAYHLVKTQSGSEVMVFGRDVRDKR